MHILKHLFPVNKMDSKRVVTMSNTNDIISIRNHTYNKESHKDVDLTELGPRFDLKPY